MSRTLSPSLSLVLTLSLPLSSSLSPSLLLSPSIVLSLLPSLSSCQLANSGRRSIALPSPEQNSLCLRFSRVSTQLFGCSLEISFFGITRQAVDAGRVPSPPSARLPLPMARCQQGGHFEDGTGTTTTEETAAGGKDIFICRCCCPPREIALALGRLLREKLWQLQGGPWSSFGLRTKHGSDLLRTGKAV